MGTKIYVGNLPWQSTDEQLESLFAEHGEVTEAKIVTDRDTGRSRGFGFVTMADSGAAATAIAALNGHAVDGRNLVVNEAHEQGARGGGSGGRPGGGRGPYGPRNAR